MTSAPEVLHGKCVEIDGKVLVLEDGTMITLESPAPSNGTAGQTVLDMLVRGKDIAYIIAFPSSQKDAPSSAYVWAENVDVTMIVSFLADECT